MSHLLSPWAGRRGIPIPQTPQQTRNRQKHKLNLHTSHVTPRQVEGHTLLYTTATRNRAEAHPISFLLSPNWVEGTLSRARNSFIKLCSVLTRFSTPLEVTLSCHQPRICLPQRGVEGHLNHMQWRGNTATLKVGGQGDGKSPVICYVHVTRFSTPFELTLLSSTSHLSPGTGSKGIPITYFQQPETQPEALLSNYISYR
jgi:hypothetical protein